jgi:MATE family multidrug resistance protein
VKPLHPGAVATPSRRAIVSQVLGLTWPVIVEQLLGMAVGLVNTYIVGHLGAAALAAVGLSLQLSNLLAALFSAVGVGSTALVARHIGAGEREEAERIAGQSLLLAAGLGLLAALLCLLWSRPVLGALGGEEDVVDLGRAYLLAVGTTMPLMAVLFVGNAVLRGAGDTRTPMLVMALLNLINVTVSWSFVYGLGPLPALGMAGAGIGSAAGVGIGGFLVALALLRGRSTARLRVKWAWLRPHPQRAWRLLRIGVPSGAEQTAMRLAQMVMTTVVTHLGTTAYAGHQLGIQLLSVAFMPGFAFSVAATTLVGQELGRGAPRRAEACVYVACWISLALMCGVGAVTFVTAEPLLCVFTSDPQVVAQGLHAVRACAFMQFPLAWYFVLTGALRGAGDTRFVLLVQAVCIWLVRLPLAYRLGLALGLALPGVWAAMVVDMTGRAAFLALRFRSGAWKRLHV